MEFLVYDGTNALYVLCIDIVFLVHEDAITLSALYILYVTQVPLGMGFLVYVYVTALCLLLTYLVPTKALVPTYTKIIYYYYMLFSVCAVFLVQDFTGASRC